MFDELYESRRTLDRHESAPLFLERVGFLNDLSQQEFSTGTLRFIAEYLLIVSTQLKLADQPDDNFNPGRIADAAEDWANRVHRSHTVEHMRSAKRSFICYASRWLAVIARLEASVTPVFRYDELIALCIQGKPISCKETVCSVLIPTGTLEAFIRELIRPDFCHRNHKCGYHVRTN